MRTERMPWKDIKQAYPDRWVRLEDVEWEDNGVDVVSAVVTRVGKPTAMDLRDAMSGKSVERFTVMNPLPEIGAACI